MSAEAFVSAARDIILSHRAAKARGEKGIVWRHRGRKPWALDCVGFVVIPLQKAGMAGQDVKGYGREPWDGMLQKTLRERFGEPVDPRPGDIAVIRWRRGEPSHIGIIGDHPSGLSLIHMHNINGPCEQALVADIRKCLVECYRPWPV